MQDGFVNHCRTQGLLLDVKTKPFVAYRKRPTNPKMFSTSLTIERGVGSDQTRVRVSSAQAVL